MRRATILVMAVLVMFAPGVSASAAVKTVRDERGPEQSNVGNRLISATVRYAPTKIVWRLRLERVSKKQTQVFGTVMFPDGDFTRVWSKFRDGEKFVGGRAYVGDDVSGIPTGLTATWDLRRDVITLVMWSGSNGWTHPHNRAASFGAYTVEKGAFHGPLCPIDEDTGLPRDCNDDAIWIRRLRKG